MDTASLTVATSREGRSWVLSIAGELDLATAGRLIPAMNGLAGDLGAQSDRVILDLAGLGFLDVAGARALIAAVQALPGGHPVTVRSISPAAGRLLGLLGWSLETPQRLTPSGPLPREPIGNEPDAEQAQGGCGDLFGTLAPALADPGP